MGSVLILILRVLVEDGHGWNTRGSSHEVHTDKCGEPVHFRPPIKRAEKPICKGFVVTKVSPLLCDKSTVWRVSMQPIDSAQFNGL